MVMPTWLGSGLEVAALVMLPMLAGWLRKPKVHERAMALDAIARGAAALAMSLAPKASWAEKLSATIAQMEKAAGLPTANRDAIERAAAGALSQMGELPKTDAAAVK